MKKVWLIVIGLIVLTALVILATRWLNNSSNLTKVKVADTTLTSWTLLNNIILIFI